MARDLERVERIQSALREAKLDALVCGFPSNVLLLTGYFPIVGTSIAIATKDGQIVLVAPEDEKDLAAHCGAGDIVPFQAGSLDRIEDAAAAIGGPLRNALRALGLESAAIGFESDEWYEPSSYAAMHIWGAGMFDLLTAAAASATFADACDLLQRMRSVKTCIEIDRIRRACRIAEIGFTDGARHVHAGAAEAEAAAWFRMAANVRGIGFEGVERADAYVFCMSGPNAASAYGAYARSHCREFEITDLVLTHCNSHGDGYWTDITRTYVIGAPDARQQEMYNAIFEARAAALAAIRPGALACDVDRAARDVLASRGFGDAFKHPAGHGVGFAAIDHNALPRIHPRSRETLESGMVFNIEPGIYIDGYGGMRHCDVVAVTADGPEVLTPFQQNLEDLVK